MPDRDKLNANFDGYKLSETSIPCVSRALTSRVNVTRLKEDQFSFQHVRSFSLHNHLVLDPWDQSSVYWYAEDCTIQQAKLEVCIKASVLVACTLVGHSQMEHKMEGLRGLWMHVPRFLYKYLCFVLY